MRTCDTNIVHCLLIRFKLVAEFLLLWLKWWLYRITTFAGGSCFTNGASVGIQCTFWPNFFPLPSFWPVVSDPTGPHVMVSKHSDRLFVYRDRTHGPKSGQNIQSLATSIKCNLRISKIEMILCNIYPYKLRRDSNYLHSCFSALSKSIIFLRIWRVPF